jgi:hypothetical protein
MPKTQETELTHERFWNRMQKNSAVVERMPAWAKGSPVNQRAQPESKAADQTAIVKPAPTTNR